MKLRPQKHRVKYFTFKPLQFSYLEDWHLGQMLYRPFKNAIWMGKITSHSLSLLSLSCSKRLLIAINIQSCPGKIVEYSCRNLCFYFRLICQNKWWLPNVYCVHKVNSHLSLFPQHFKSAWNSEYILTWTLVTITKCLDLSSLTTCMSRVSTTALIETWKLAFYQGLFWMILMNIPE